jgi:hypothetical protein
MAAFTRLTAFLDPEMIEPAAVNECTVDRGVKRVPSAVAIVVNMSAVVLKLVSELISV